VVKKKLRQWYLRITEYADRLLEGLERIEFSDAMKEMQTNWIGRSSGAEIDFEVKKPPLSPPKGEETGLRYQTATSSLYNFTKTLAVEKRKNPTPEEQVLWQLLRSDKTGFHIRRQHIIGSYIVDFACLDKMVTIEIDGGYHNDPEIQFYDKERTHFLKGQGFTEIRFTNDEVKNDPDTVVKKITETLANSVSVPPKSGSSKVSPLGGDLEGAFKLRVYTTRPDTIFGVDFMVIAPELDIVEGLKSDEQAAAVDEYLAYVKSRSERERMAEKKISGVFTGAYAINPFDGREIPIWISEYVLAGYGTGAIMAVPCGDERDHKFAQHFNIPITNIIGAYYNGEEANPTKEATLENSGFLNGLLMKDAIEVAINAIEEKGIGVRKKNFKMRDAAFSRQRYWGEPFPIIWKNGIAYPLSEDQLPLVLPVVDKYGPGPDGEGPLSNIKNWTDRALETNTMPGYAGSSWYFLRYMDPKNDTNFCDRKVSDYWNQVDLYIGGTEHAVGHLLYSRMWTKALYDLGHIGYDEPYKKLVNQGMIQGSSRFVYRIELVEYLDAGLKDVIRIIEEGEKPKTPVFISYNLVEKYFIENKVTSEGIFFLKNYISTFPEFRILEHELSSAEVSKIHVNVEYVDGFELDLKSLKGQRLTYKNACFILDDGSVYKIEEDQDFTGKYICGAEVEKMSKSKYNTVNPDDLVYKYGADTFRMYEMFLGPVELSKPWDTKGIEGVHRFLKKFWRLFADELKGLIVTDEAATPEELKVLHRTIKKIEDDTERFSFNTAVSGFMIATNELSDLKCHKRSVLEPLLVLITPYAPHIAAELWSLLGHADNVIDAPYPVFDAKHVAESSKEYPISINGKLRTTLNIALDAAQSEVESLVLANDVVQKWLEGKAPKKIIFVKGKMVNIVI